MNTHDGVRSGHRIRLRARVMVTTVAAASMVSLGASAAGATVAHSPKPATKTALSASTTAALKAALAKGAAPSHWVAGGPAFSAKGLKGKTVFMLLDGSENQFTASFVSGVTAAVKAAGMTLQIGNGNQVTSQDDQVLENAINAHVAAIMLAAQTPSTLGSALNQAKAAGIPVIESFIGDPHLPTAAEKALGIVADATYCYTCTGNLAADYEILKTGGNMTSVVQQFPGSPPSDATALGWKQSVSKFCAKTCKISYDNVTLGANMVQEFQSGTQVAAQNPSVNTIFPVYDFQMGYMLPELQAANASSRIDLLSENADLAQMQEMVQGTSVKVDVGNPVAWDGWSAVDEMLRALKHVPVVKDEKVPVRLFDTANVKSLDLTANPASWYGGATYGADYLKLWGLK